MRNKDYINIEVVNKILRNENEIPTTPSTDYKTDGTWVNTDVYNGQICVNVYDNKIYYRWNSGITELLSSNSNIVVNNLCVNSLSATSERIITTSGSCNLENYLQTDQEFSTNSTIIGALLNQSNWSYNEYSGTTVGLVEGQKYQDDNFLYIFNNSSVRRYKNNNCNITLVSSTITASTLIDIVVFSGSTGQTIYLPTTLTFGECVIKNICENSVNIFSSNLIDGITGQTINQYDSCNIFIYNGKYYIK
jgi:hypothetical protein